MRTAQHSRRQFIVATGAGAACSLAVSGTASAYTAHVSASRPETSTHLGTCAVVHMRPSSKTQNPLASNMVMHRMCQLIDESTQWGGNVDLVIFPNLENLTLSEDTPQIEILKNKAQALGTCLSFECCLTTKGGRHEPAFVFIESQTGLITPLSEHTTHTVRQMDSISPSAQHDHIRYVQLTPTMMRLFKSPRDSFEGLAG